MSAFLDAKRFLYLDGVGIVTDDDCRTLLKQLVEQLDRYGFNDKLYRENLKLRGHITNIEAQLSEVNGKALVMAKHIGQLEKMISDGTQRQTLVRELSTSMNQAKQSPECELDKLADPNFVACRNERCTRQDLHAADQCTPMGRGARRKRKDVNA